MDARKILRIAKWEVTKNAGGVDRRTLVVMALAVLAMGAVAAVSAGGASGLESGIYRVGVDESSPYYGPAATDPAFDVREPDSSALARGQQELRFQGTALVEARPTAKGRAAQSEFRSTVDRYNERRLANESNQSAAYPVSVTLVYEEQTGVTEQLASDSGDEAGAGGGTDAGDSGSGDGANGDGSSGAGGTGQTGGTDTDGGSTLGGLGAGLTGGDTSGTPADIEPPFPFESLILAFLFLVPMNFVIQAYGSTMLSERLKRRGELLLVSPVTRTDIVAGKTLPYFLAAIGVVAVITAGLRLSGVAPGGSHVAVLAVTPLALLFLSATFCGAMFARSFKELTFVTVTVTVSLTSYAFVPAIFTEVTPIALISPLTIVVRDLQGQAVPLSEFAFSTAPPTATAFVLFGLGAGLYREEDMFTQRAIPLKVLDALAGRISSPWSAAKLSAILLPFVFVAELAAIALLFALGDLSIPLVLAAVVVIEEVAKSIHLYAGYAHGYYERTVKSALVVGALSGVGFFVAEKFVLLARLADLDTIQTGEAALVTGLIPDGIPLWLVAALFLLAPLVLHVVTAAIASLGASRGRRQYLAGLAVAMVVHYGYNYTVVSALA